MQNCAIQRNTLQSGLVRFTYEERAMQRCENLRKNSLGNYESAKFGQNGRELMYSRAVWDEANHFRKHIDC
jgi:hypothetical protein